MKTATDGRCTLFSEALWYCAQMDAGKEKRLKDGFARIGIETYLPMHRAHRSREVYVYPKTERRYYAPLVPMFPGYLFARLGDHEWARSKTMLGTSIRPHWVNFGSGPVIVPEDVLLAISEGSTAMSKKAPAASVPYQKDELIEITRGPLAGMKAIFSHDSNERVFALITLLGREKLVDFDISDTCAAVV